MDNCKHDGILSFRKDEGNYILVELGRLVGEKQHHIRAQCAIGDKVFRTMPNIRFCPLCGERLEGED